MKRAIFGVTIFTMAVLLACADNGQYCPESDFDVNITGWAVAITRYLGSNTVVRIPPTIQGLPVTVIDVGAFSGKQLTSISIPDSVTDITNWAFADNQLTSVIIPGSVTHIGPLAFMNNQLASVSIGTGVTHIEDQAFRNNRLTSVSIPVGVTNIQDGAFESNQLTSVVIPDSVTHIGFMAFHDNQLTSVSVPSGAFVTHNAFEAGVTVTRREQQTDDEADFAVRVIDDGTAVQITRHIGSNTAVRIPPTVQGLPVTRIGENAFLGSGLLAVRIPNSVTHIDAWAFEGNMLAEISIPDSVTHIFAGAFEHNHLTEVNIPDSVTYMGAVVFAFNQLASVSIPDSVTVISSGAFEGNMLTSVTIPAGVTIINARAFQYNLLTSVSIPDSVTHIFQEAFIGNLLTSVSVASHTEVHPDAFDPGVTVTRRLQGYCPESDFDVTVINGNAVEITRYVGSNTVVRIPAQIQNLPVTSIGNQAFMDKQLISVSVPSGASVDPNAFSLEVDVTRR